MRIEAMIAAGSPTALGEGPPVPPPAARVNVLGVGISAIDMRIAIETIEAWIAAGARQYVTVTGVHGVMECQHDEDLRRIHNAAGMVTPDGMPMVWMGRLHGFRHVDRVYGPDLMAAVCELSCQRGWRHFLYGGGDGVAERLRSCLEARFPGIVIAGTCTPPFRPLTPEEDAAVVETVNAAAPDIVWVGLSTPKQERWMAAHVGRVHASVLVGVGAAFDIHSGLKPEAPRWIQRSGLQWVFRLMAEPRRLWRRYFETVPRFLWLVTRQLIGLNRYPDPAPGTVSSR
jgi:N-acetylglucosaminyldiphosphoundecaprenol N-acetyl-beta-D-mannosaminyltransferase